MNLSIEYESPRLPSLKGTEEHPAYIIAVTCLISLWVVFSVITALVAVAVFVPGHLGLSDWLRVLGNLWPGDSPMFTT